LKEKAVIGAEGEKSGDKGVKRREPEKGKKEGWSEEFT
jgi:hypothetical protein